MSVRFLSLVLTAVLTSSAQALPLDLKTVTFVPGVIVVSGSRPGLTSLGAVPEQRFEGCVQMPTRLLSDFGRRETHTGERAAQNIFDVVLLAKRAGEKVSMRYYVGQDGRCYIYAVSF
ncbi:MAG: hypothetical protein K2Y51_10190 [Gammaproteobacteria bacterium]|jgi:hypothetical protein|nr:hypothetical protein [Gammaproteobacteria bacterium]